MTDDDDEEISAADEQALTDLFASLVDDAPASEVSPLELVKLGRIEQRHELDARIKRFKVVRNVLVAAALAALVVLIVPHLGSGSSTTAASSSSSSSAAATFAASSGSAPQQGGATAAASAAPAVAASGSAAAGSAASSGPAESGAMLSAASAASAPAASATESGAMSSGAAAPNATGATKGVTTKSLGGSTSAGVTSSEPAASGTACPALPAKVLAAFTSAFPAGYFGSPGATAEVATCNLFHTRLPATKGHVTVDVTVRKAAVGACEKIGCAREPGQSGIYVGVTSGRDILVDAPVYVYANGYEVAVEADRAGSNPVGPPFDQLVAGARAVIKTLG